MSLPDALTILVDGNRSSFEPRELLRGVATWQLNQAPKSIEVRLLWYTAGKGTRDLQTIASITVRVLSQSGRKAFEFPLPDGPYSFSGKLISLIWAVEIVVELGARSVRAEFVMAPNHAEVVLGSVPKDAR